MKSYKRFASAVLGIAMAASCMAPVTAFAAEDFQQPADNTVTGEHPNTVTMKTSTPVYKIGKNSYYKVNADGSVVYATQDSTGFTAIPSAYIEGSTYNKDNTLYGVYTTVNPAGGFDMHYVDLADCEQRGDAFFWNHGTADEAKVSDDKDAGSVDTATNKDPSMSTDFYLYLDNDSYIPDETPPVETVVPGTTDDGRVEYEITVATVNHVNVKATVPLYVCMYGFRSSGNVVTPTKDAYQLKNYSTIDKNDRTYIADIVKVTHYSKIFDSDHSNEELYAIAYDEATNSYTYWYSDPTITAGWTQPANYKKITDKHINASGQYYCIFIDNEWDFKAAGVLDGDKLRETVAKIDEKHPLSTNFTVRGDPTDTSKTCDFGKEFAVGKSLTTSSTREGLALKVTELQAEPATWRVVPMSTKALKHGEIAMSIAPEKAMYNASAVDLSTCSAPLDITENGWFIDGCAKDKVKQNDEAAAADAVTYDNAPVLGLVTTAKIAGSNVNEVGCTPVVRVTYSVVPMFETGSTQTATASMSTGEYINSNRK